MKKSLLLVLIFPCFVNAQQTKPTQSDSIRNLAKSVILLAKRVDSLVAVNNRLIKQNRRLDGAVQKYAAHDTVYTVSLEKQAEFYHWFINIVFALLAAGSYGYFEIRYKELRRTINTSIGGLNREIEKAVDTTNKEIERQKESFGELSEDQYNRTGAMCFERGKEVMPQDKYDVALWEFSWAINSYLKAYELASTKDHQLTSIDLTLENVVKILKEANDLKGSDAKGSSVLDYIRINPGFEFFRDNDLQRIIAIEDAKLLAYTKSILGSLQKLKEYT